MATEGEVHHQLVAKKRDFQLALRSPAGQSVLADLAAYCRANETVARPTQDETYILIGRREVWLRIQEYLQLTPEELFAIKTGRPINLTGENDANT